MIVRKKPAEDGLTVKRKYAAVEIGVQYRRNVDRFSRKPLRAASVNP
jgi:hypothetical protein